MQSCTAVDLACSTGVTISVAQRAALQSSLPLLQKNYKFSGVFLFGKILCKAGDYLVAYGLEGSTSKKTWFYCVDGVAWAQLTAPSDADTEMTSKMPPGVPFTGDASHEYQLPAAPNASGEEGEGDGEAPKLREEARLAVTVAAIDAETALAPNGAVRQTSTGAIVGNPAFSGLSAAAAQNIDSYSLLNNAKDVSPLVDDATKAVDFLKPASSIVPSGSLCARYDEATGLSTVRSLLWPGAVAFASASGGWGNGYFGTGEKNADIAFMLP